MARIISLFNHKGGVSKTTTTFNIGCRLAKDKRVLLVDGDPQANLTALMCGFNSWESGKVKITGEHIEQKYIEFNKRYRSLYSYLDDFVNTRSLNLDDVIATSELFFVKDRPNLFLLPGGIETAELQPKITAAVNFAFSPNMGMEVYRKTPGAFRKLLLELAKRYDIDYIIVDLSPDLGLLNQCFLFNSDYFIIPATPDYFSIQAIKSIAKFLPDYYNNFSSFRSENQKLNGFTMPGQPKFLGYITQRFTLQSGKKQTETEKEAIIPTKRFQYWIEKIDNCVQEILMPRLIASNMNINHKEIPINIKIPEFHSFIADLQSQIKPVFELDPKKFKRLNERNKATATKKLDKLRQLFNTINTIILDQAN